MPAAGKNLEQLEFLHIAGENAKWSKCFLFLRQFKKKAYYNQNQPTKLRLDDHNFFFSASKVLQAGIKCTLFSHYKSWSECWLWLVKVVELLYSVFDLTLIDLDSILGEHQCDLDLCGQLHGQTNLTGQGSSLFLLGMLILHQLGCLWNHSVLGSWEVSGIQLFIVLMSLDTFPHCLPGY